jgi:hypothetical protein
MSSKVHSLMKNTDDIHAISRQSVEQDVRADSIFRIAGADFVAWAPSARVLSNP